MSKTLKITLWAIVIVLVLWIVFGAGKEKTSSLVKIGVIAPLTGVVADYGEEMRKGISAPVAGGDEIFVFEDDKCDPKEAVTAFKKLVEFDKINFIIGPGCGSPQEAILPLIKEKNIIVLVPSAASFQLYAQSGNNFFNIQYSLENESKFIGEQLNSKQYKKVALVHYKNAFSAAHAKSFKESYKGEIVDIILTD